MTTFDFLRREPDIRAYKRGQTIFKEGDPGADCMFAVVDGAVDIELGGVVVERVLPVAGAHLTKLKSGSETLMTFPAEAF